MIRSFAPLLMLFLPALAHAQAQPRPFPWNEPAAPTGQAALTHWAKLRETLPLGPGLPRIRWDAFTGGATRVLGKLSPPDPHPPEHIAKRWIEDNIALANLGGSAFSTLMSLEAEESVVSARFTLVRWRQWVDGVPLQHALELAVGLDGGVLVVQGTLVPVEEFEGGFVIDAAHAADALRTAAGEPPSAPATTDAAWIQGASGVIPAWHVEIPWYSNAQGSIGGGWSAWVSAEDARVLTLTETTSYDDVGWQARDYNKPSYATIRVEELADSGAVTMPPDPAYRPCGRTAATGGWLTVFDGEALSGLYNEGDDAALTYMPLYPA